jgi:DNA-binding response OmpR family regulator
MSRDVILLVEDDDEVCIAIEARLKKAGYGIVVARNEEDARLNPVIAQSAVGLILLNQKMHSDEALAVGRRIRERAGLDAATPLIVLPFEYETSMEGQDHCVGGNDYKTYMVDTDQLTELIKRLLPV